MVFVAISLAFAGVALVVLQDRSVRKLVEQQVRAHAVFAANRLAAGVSPITAVDTGTSGFEVLQVLDARGEVLAASPQLAGAPALQPPRLAASDTVAASTGSQMVDAAPLLVVERTVTTKAGVRVVLAAGSLAAGSRGTATVAELMGLGVPLLAVITGAATFALTGRALRPVEAIRSQVAGFTGHDLGRRVTEPYAYDEVGRLARTMNDMLARLDGAQVAQRRFVADASHELRSPLATIIARLELGLRRGPTDTDMAAMMPEAQRMTRLIEDLLLLTRADERGLAPRRSDIDLDELVETEAARLRETTSIQVRVDTAPARISGDRAQLTRVLRNLLDNAARHAANRVALRVRVAAGRTYLEVSDDGPGIPAVERKRVFDRFVRLDEGRAREAGGAGLGLAIVADLIAAHDGAVEAREADDGGALLVVCLPSQPITASSALVSEPPSHPSLA
jgi:signal transduction histidine kinase